MGSSAFPSPDVGGFLFLIAEMKLDVKVTGEESKLPVTKWLSWDKGLVWSLENLTLWLKPLTVTVQFVAASATE